MYLRTLRLTNFRNFVEQRLEIPAGGVAVVGDNGQGKTNLLEAIYYLEIFRSFRGVPDEQLVRFGEEVFRVEGEVEDGGRERRIAAAYDRRQKRKKITVDGAEPPRIGDALGRVGVVVFSPSDVSLVSGSPSYRRRFLDILLSLAEPRYLEELQRYRKVLLQRNALLRGGADPAMVAAWNEGLVTSGSRIAVARRRWVRASAGRFAERVAEISGGTAASLEYEPALPLDDLPDEATPAAVAALFRAELERVAERERRRATTLVGPHRDDLRLRAAGGGAGEWIDLRTFGSGGQQRTAAVALRMIEGETLRERLGSHPLILMDDVFAELDESRSRRILEWVEREPDAQVILTAPKPRDFDLRDGSLNVWRIAGGVVSAL